MLTSELHSLEHSHKGAHTTHTHRVQHNQMGHVRHPMNSTDCCDWDPQSSLRLEVKILTQGHT